MSDKIRVIDYTVSSGLFVEIPMEVLRAQLVELMDRLERERNNFLDIAKSNLEDIETAVLLMLNHQTGMPLSGKAALAQDAINRAVELDNKNRKITAFANSYQMLEVRLGMPHIIKLTLEQAREFGL